MSNLPETADSRLFQRNLMTSFIQIAGLVALVSLCVSTIGPFAGLVVWGVVLAVAIFPLHLKLADSLGGRPKLSAALIVITGLLLVMVPGWIVTKSAIASTATLAADLKSGTLSIPPPSESVADWPLVGQRVYSAWNGAAEDATAVLNEFKPQVRQISEWLVRKVGAMAIGALQMALSIVIAGVAMLYAAGGYRLCCSIATRISAQRGQHWTDLSVATVRSVTNGVLGVAVIQAALAAIGFFLVGLPHAGIFAAIVLITSVVQVPAVLIIAPIIAWVFSFASPAAATVFAIYSVFVALSDNILKPILLGRGVDLPALVVLIGAIGGMIQFGIIGLFLGAVILGLGYTILSDWLQSEEKDSAPAESGDAGMN